MKLCTYRKEQSCKKYLIRFSCDCKFGGSIHLYFATTERSKASIISLSLRIYPCPMVLPLSSSFCCHPPHLFILSLHSTFGPYTFVPAKPTTLHGSNYVLACLQAIILSINLSVHMVVLGINT